MPVTDSELVEQARAGSREAFTTLYQRYRLPVTRYARRIVNDTALAEDVVQDAFVSALRKLPNLRDPARFRPWLFSIVHRTAVDEVRAEGPTLLPELPEVPARTAEDSVAAELVWDAAASLEPRQLAILELTVREEVSNAELGQALGVSTAHAAVLAHRARTALGHAVRILLLTRSRPSCTRLAALVPDRPRKLTIGQRASVDRHLRRCPVCSGLARKVSVPMAVLAALWLAQQRTAGIKPLAVRLAVVGAAVAAGLVGWSLLPTPAPAPSAAPLPTVTASSTTSLAPTTTPVPTTTTTTAPPTTTTTTKPPPPPSEDQRFVVLVNQQRASRGCAPLREDQRLNRATSRHSKDMAANGYIDFTGPTGDDLAADVREAGYPSPSAMAVAASTETAEQTLDKLADRSAFDCGYRSIGVSRAVGGPCHYYWSMVLGRQ
ncbi:hypothetical protein GCM10010174_57920 [Kutzneria viridogrisea]|uniref:RNA polymerase sigma factor n=1 Tax=Kutzneria viridogrisea TaxID=47990 RepID=A0ABR6BKE6_9PSEU|nr:RNA polymerase sigma factor (sigma-70 family) [Kutzneria viridogrisea]